MTAADSACKCQSLRFVESGRLGDVIAVLSLMPRGFYAQIVAVQQHRRLGESCVGLLSWVLLGIWLRGARGRAGVAG